MSFTIAIVGRPNVGKSTLFNRLIGEKKAIIDDISGVTRDRIYGECEWNGKIFDVIDTGGFVPDSTDVFEKHIREQVLIAIEEASLLLFVVDAATGLGARWDQQVDGGNAQIERAAAAHHLDGQRARRRVVVRRDARPRVTRPSASPPRRCRRCSNGVGRRPPSTLVPRTARARRGCFHRPAASRRCGQDRRQRHAPEPADRPCPASREPNG